MPDPFRTLLSSHDGPVAPAQLAAARWGAGAWRRLARGADAALLEARLRACAAALARVRQRSLPAGAKSGALERLVRGVAFYRAAASMLARN